MSSKQSSRGGGGGFRSRLGQLNPAFAAAHGISPAKPGNSKKAADPTSSTEGSEDEMAFDELPISPCPVRDFVPSAMNNNKSTTSTTSQVNQVITKARKSGKLQASDADLSTPLPKVLFEFPSLAATVDMSMDTNPDDLKPWESHVAETLTIVDFSDNEGITEFPTLDHKSDFHTSCSGVERYRSVQVFRAKRCQLKSFPVTKTLVNAWQQLTTLDLSGNQLSGEFPLLSLPKSVRELDLSSNKIISLKSSVEPSTSIDLPQLLSLDISANQITSTGISPIMNVPLLQRLNCGHNKIYNLNYVLKSISSCEKSLTTLQAPKSMLSDLDGEQPINLTAFISLLSADLSENCLCKIPKIPSSLQRLNVNHNSIKGIQGLLEEDEVGDMYISSLVVLQLQRNKIAALDPKPLSKLIQLNRLDLQNNSLQNLPVELGYLPNLSQIFLEGNHLLSLRSSGVRGDLTDTKAILTRLRNRGPDQSDTAKDKSGRRGKSSVDAIEKANPPAKNNSASVGNMLASLLVGTKNLNYEGKHAHMLPFQLLEELGSSSKEVVDGIERLKIAKNQLQNIEEEWFRRLPQLQVLEAHDNRLADLPAAIRELALTHIHLSRNRLDSHAIQFSILHTSTKSNVITDTLQVLDLSSNCLESVPPALFQQFKSLRSLNLSRNKIASLKNIVDAPHPPSLPALESLDLSENRIGDLGGDDFPIMLAAGCPNLQAFLLHNNELQMIPLTLGLLDTLQVFDIRGNPQRMIRYEILEKNTSNILSYFRSRMTSKNKANAADKMKELLDTPPPDPDDVPPATQTNGATRKSNSQAKAVDENKTLKQSPSSKTTAKTHAPSNNPSSATPISKTPTKNSRLPPPKVGTPKSKQGLTPVVTSSHRNYASPTTSSKQHTPNKNHNTPGSNNNNNNAKKVSSPLLEELEKNIEQFVSELDNPGLSEAKRYALKKKCLKS